MTDGVVDRQCQVCQADLPSDALLKARFCSQCAFLLRHNARQGL